MAYSMSKISLPSTSCTLAFDFNPRALQLFINNKTNRSLAFRKEEWIGKRKQFSQKDLPTYVTEACTRSLEIPAEELSCFPSPNISVTDLLKDNYLHGLRMTRNKNYTNTAYRTLNTCSIMVVNNTPGAQVLKTPILSEIWGVVEMSGHLGEKFWTFCKIRTKSAQINQISSGHNWQPIRVQYW